MNYNVLHTYNSLKLKYRKEPTSKKNHVFLLKYYYRSILHFNIRANITKFELLNENVHVCQTEITHVDVAKKKKMSIIKKKIRLFDY